MEVWETLGLLVPLVQVEGLSSHHLGRGQSPLPGLYCCSCGRRQVRATAATCGCSHYTPAGLLPSWPSGREHRIFLCLFFFLVYAYWQVWVAGLSSAQSESTWKIKRENSGSPQWWCSQRPRPLFNPPSFHVSESFDDCLLTCLQRIQ